MYLTGYENFLRSAVKKYRGKKLAVLCNQASVDRNLRHISETILDKKLRLDLACFFGPQHGMRGEKQDNMIESDDFVDPVTRLPVYSLYGTTRIPTDEAMQKFDVLLIDLQDIGTRIYTFMYTMANCMRAAKKNNKKIVVLDRPNPINGKDTEGNILEENFTSFVGQYPICTRHGMTLAELAYLFNEEFGIGCDLDHVPMKGWSRKEYADHYWKHWVFPSPNIPTLDSAITFPGTVHFEGTNVSEGRGTTRPLEWVGAPYIQPDSLAKEMNRQKLPGVYFRAMFFQPTYQKWMGQVCGGVQIHVLNRNTFRPFQAGVRLLFQIAKMHPKEFAWKQPPYEYEHEKMPIDLIAGTAKLREACESQSSLRDFERFALKSLDQFRKVRRKYLLYP